MIAASGFWCACLAENMARGGLGRGFGWGFGARGA